jgi:hypothetical protein
MSPDELATYLRHAPEGYRRQRIEFGGETEAQAQAAADRDFADLFPNGEPGPDQFLFVTRDEHGDRVGLLWLALRANRRDDDVHLRHRGRSRASAARLGAGDHVRGGGLGAGERSAPAGAERVRREHRRPGALSERRLQRAGGGHGEGRLP